MHLAAARFLPGPHSQGGRAFLPVQAGLVAVLVMLAVGVAPAQDALRSSFAYAALPANQNPAVNLAPDRPHLGPVQLSFGGYLGADYLDNITYAQSNTLSDEIFHAGVNAGFDWPVTELSDLNLNTSIGYDHYLRYSQYDTFEVAPNSALSWNVLIPDGSLTFFDQFSYSQQVATQPALTGVANFPIFDNSTGVRVNWLPGQWAFQAGYSHEEYFSDSSAFDYLNHSSENFFVRGGWNFAQNTQAGLEASAGLNSYQVAVQPDSLSLSVGPYLEWQVTQAIHATLRGGPTVYFFDSAATNSPSSTLTSYYVSLLVSQQLTEHLSHQIDIERSVSLGLNQGGGYIEQFSTSYSLSWALTQSIGLNMTGAYQNGTQPLQNTVTLFPGFNVLVNQTENYDLFSFGPSVSWRATDHLSTTLGYSFYLRDSNLPDRGYTADVLSWRLTYAF